MPWHEPGLFDSPDQIAVPYAPKSATSRHAAIQVQPKAGSQAAMILRELDARPQTMHELATSMGLPLSSVCARIGWLKRHGFVEGDGVRPGPYGVMNQILRAKVR